MCKHVFLAGEHQHWTTHQHRWVPGQLYWVTFCSFCKVRDLESVVGDMKGRIREMKDDIRKMDKLMKDEIRKMREEMDALDYQGSWNRYPDYEIHDQQATPWIPHTHQSSQTDDRTRCLLDDPRDLEALKIENDYQRRLANGEVDMQPPDHEEELPKHQMSS